MYHQMGLVSPWAATCRLGASGGGGWDGTVDLDAEGLQDLGVGGVLRKLTLFPEVKLFWTCAKNFKTPMNLRLNKLPATIGT